SRGTAVAGLDGVVDRSYRGFAERFAEAYVAEMAAFVEVVAGTAASPCPGREALEASYVAEACTRSVQENRTVTLTEVKWNAEIPAHRDDSTTGTTHERRDDS